MKLLPILFSCSLFLLTYSCSIQGSFQGLYGYQKKVTKEAPKLIQKPTGDICQLSYQPGIIYSTNGKMLKGCLENLDRSLVYIWQPNCRGTLCIPPDNVQKMCIERNIDLFIVAEYYDQPKMQKTYQLQSPILGVDCQYYRSNLTSRYLTRFLRDLLEEEKIKIKETKMFYYFEKGIMTQKNSDLFGLWEKIDQP